VSSKKRIPAPPHCKEPSAPTSRNGAGRAWTSKRHGDGSSMPREQKAERNGGGRRLRPTVRILTAARLRWRVRAFERAHS
jgi:hypothetical protein